MKLYIAGKITNNPDYKIQFAAAEAALIKKGHSVMNPARLGEGKEFTHDDYMKATAGMQSICDGIVLLGNWKESSGAKEEHEKAVLRSQKVFHGVEAVPDYNKRCCVVCNAEESHVFSRNECLSFLKITDGEFNYALSSGTPKHGFTVDVMD